MAEPKPLGDGIPRRRLTAEQEARADELLARDAESDTPEAMREQVRQLQRKVRCDQYLRSVPARYAGATLADLERWDVTSRDAVTSWLDSKAATLFLVGAVGTGKTHAAYAVLSRALEAGTWVYGCTVLDLLDHLRPSAPESFVPRVAEQCDLFLFDDLAAERSTEWAVEQFSGIVDARTREGKRQIVTTNATYAELEERLGRRVMSRLAGGAQTVLLQGADQRRAHW